MLHALMSHRVRTSRDQRCKLSAGLAVLATRGLLSRGLPLPFSGTATGPRADCCRAISFIFFFFVHFPSLVSGREQGASGLPPLGQQRGELGAWPGLWCTGGMACPQVGDASWRSLQMYDSHLLAVASPMRLCPNPIPQILIRKP